MAKQSLKDRSAAAGPPADVSSAYRASGMRSRRSKARSVDGRTLPDRCACSSTLRSARHSASVGKVDRPSGRYSASASARRRRSRRATAGASPR